MVTTTWWNPCKISRSSLGVTMKWNFLLDSSLYCICSPPFLISLYHKLLYNSTLCEAKLPFLLSLLSYLLSGNDNLREERRTKREKWREQKETTIFCRKLSFLFGRAEWFRCHLLISCHWWSVLYDWKNKRNRYTRK